MVLSLSNTSRQIVEGEERTTGRDEVGAEMTELRDIERANTPITYGTHERMAEREVEI